MNSNAARTAPRWAQTAPGIAVDPGNPRGVGLADQLPGNLDSAIDFGLDAHLGRRAIRAQHGIWRQKRDQPVQVPALRRVRRMPRRSPGGTARGVDRGNSSSGNLLAGTAGELAGCFGRALDDGGDLIERQPEEIVQDERGRFER